MREKEWLELMNIQEGFIKAGFQWEESIFNDTVQHDCYIAFTDNTDPSYLSKNPGGDCGWGRFTRMSAWKQAHKWLLEEYKK